MEGLPRTSKGQTALHLLSIRLLHCCWFSPNDAPLPPSPLLTLLCLNIFVHFAKFLKHLLPPPLLLCLGKSLAKACDQNDFPHQKTVLPFSGTPLPAQVTLWTAVSSDLNSDFLCLSLLLFSLHKTDNPSNEAWQEQGMVFLLVVYLCLQQLPPSLYHIASAADAQVSHLFSSSQPMTTSWI